MIEPIYFKRKVKLYELALGLLILFAISLIFSIDFKYKLGIGLSLISAFLASWFTVINGKLIQRVNAKMKISPYTVSMSVNLEPIYSIILAVIIWPETEIMPAKFSYAFVLILAAIFINAILKNRTEKENG